MDVGVALLRRAKRIEKLNCFMIVSSQVVKDALGVIALLVAAALVGWRSYDRMMLPDNPRDPVNTALSDFRDVIFYPTRAVLAGVNPYDATEGDPNGYLNRFPVGNNFPLYSPLIFTIALPFAALPLWPSVVIWLAVNVGLTVVLAYVGWRWCGRRPTIAMTAALSAAILLSRPGLSNIYFGQATLIFTLAALAALHWARQRPYWAGVALAIAMMKPTFGGPLAILMFCRRDWRATGLGGFLGVTAALIGLAIIFSHNSNGRSVVEVLRANQQATEHDPAVDPQVSNSRIDVAVVVERLLGPEAARPARLAVPLIMLGVTGLFLWRGAAQHPELSRSLILTTIAGCVYHNCYDGLLLVVPALSTYPWGDRPRVMPTRGLGLAACALLTIPFISYFSSKQAHDLAAWLAPWVSDSAWLPGPASALFSLANGCAVGLAWLLLIVAATHTADVDAASAVSPKKRTIEEGELNEAVALTTKTRISFQPKTQSSKISGSQITTTPLPTSVYQQGGIS